MRLQFRRSKSAATAVCLFIHHVQASSPTCYSTPISTLRAEFSCFLSVSEQVAMLAVSSVSKEIRDWMDTHARSRDTERAEDARRTHVLVYELLQELLLNAPLSSVPLVLAAGCKLVGSFATLVGGGAGACGGRGRLASSPLGVTVAGSGGGDAGGGEGVGSSAPSLLPLALRYLSAGLQQEASRDRAAISVRTLAASCERAIVGSPQALETLLQVGGEMEDEVARVTLQR